MKLGHEKTGVEEATPITDYTLHTSHEIPVHDFFQ